MRLVPIVLGLLVLSVPVSAQPSAGTSSKLSWDQPNVSSAAEAQTYTYRLYLDGSATGVGISGVTCTGTTTVTCSAPFPAVTPGAHSVTVSAANAGGESGKSAPFAFTFVVVPSTPANVRLGS